MSNAAALTIVHRPELFTPVRDTRPAGMSIEEIVASVPGLPALFWERGVITIDRLDGTGMEEVPRRMWRHVRPRTDGAVPIEVNLWLPPQGGGRGTLGIIASIAIIVATLVVTGGALAPVLGPLFAAGAIGAQLAGAAVPISGPIGLKALQP